MSVGLAYSASLANVEQGAVLLQTTTRKVAHWLSRTTLPLLLTLPRILRGGVCK